MKSYKLGIDSNSGKLEFFNNQIIDAISILKLDIEGFELKALQGCETILKNQHIDFVFAEVNLIPTYERQSLLEEIIAYLRNLNYIPLISMCILCQINVAK